MFGKIGKKEMEQLQEGKAVQLSIRMITEKLIDLRKAKEALNEQEYAGVKALYNKFTEVGTCREKREMLLDEYNSTADLIITAFDQIAPFDKYQGKLSDLDKEREKKRLRNIYDAEIIDRRLNLLDRILFWMNEREISYDRLRFYAGSIAYFDAVGDALGTEKNYPESYFEAQKDLHELMVYAVNKLLEKDWPQDFDKLIETCAAEFRNFDLAARENSDTTEEYIEAMTDDLFFCAQTDPNADVSYMKNLLIQDYMNLIE
ncbi:MAG: hypothetical protein IKG46_14535 [Solobacterium sp.]|nr:hypothetical protein [Solobacterium sp.]